MPSSQYNAVKRRLGFRGKVEPGELINKSRKLSKEELAIRGLV